MQNLLNLLNISGLGTSGFVGVLSTLIFEALLNNSLVLTKGKEPGTFSRTSVAYVKDFEGLLKPVLTGESRFQGSRRVQNLVSSSEVFSGSAGGTLVDNAINSVDGRLVATQFIESNLTEIHRVLHTSSASITVGRTYITSIYVKGNGHDECSFQGDVTNNSLGGLSQFDINTGGIILKGSNVDEAWYEVLADGWFRIFTKSVAGNTTTRLQIYPSLGFSYAGDGVSGIYFYGFQIEDVTGQANQNASEYISSGAYTGGIELGDTINTISAWTPYGTNLLEQDGDAVKVTYIDHVNGAVTYFRDSNGLIADLEGGAKYLVSFEAKVDTGNSVNINTVHAGSTPVYIITSTTYISYSEVITASSSAAGNLIYSNTMTTGEIIWIRNLQISKLDHGANIDAVKYFNTENGNTVNANEVTSAIGTNISTNTLKGVQIENQEINYCPYSEDLTNGYTMSGLTILANQTIAPDGLNTMDKVNETGVTASHGFFKSFNLGATGQATFSIFTKKGTRRYAGFQALVSSSIKYAVLFDLDTGLFVEDNSTGIPVNTSYGIESYGNDIYRIWTSVNTTSINVFIYPFLSNSVTPLWLSSRPYYLGDINEYGYFWGAMVENNIAPTSYMKTEASSVTRDGDKLTYPTDKNIEDIKGAITFDFTPEYDSDGVSLHYLWGTVVDTANYLGIFHNGTSIYFRKRISGADSDSITVFPFIAGITYKLGFRWSDSTGLDIWIDGIKGNNNSNTAPIQIGLDMEIGGISFGSPGYAKFENFRIHKKDLSDEDMVLATTELGLNFNFNTNSQYIPLIF